MQTVAYIPSPSQGVWHLGFIPIRAYALMIIIGIVVAVWLGERRWTAKGGAPGVVIDVAVWAVPFGLVGGRLYHVVTDYQRYFAEGRDPLDALRIWEGGLSIWGAVLLGAVGALIACRRYGISVAALGDAVAPGIALGQAIGRWGNYWNQELYGRPLDAFWALEIDPDHRPRLEDGSRDPQYTDIATYHPTFLYESLWCVGVAVLVIWAARRYKLTHGRAFAVYLAGYTAGRFWIEWLRIDDAHHILGMRLNNWTALIVFLAAVGYVYWARNRTGPESLGSATATETAAETEPKPETEPETEPKAQAEPKAEAEDEDDAPRTGEPEAEKTEESEEPETEDSEEQADSKAQEPDPEPEPEGDDKAEDDDNADSKADSESDPRNAPEGEAEAVTGDNDTADDVPDTADADKIADKNADKDADKGEPVKDPK